MSGLSQEVPLTVGAEDWQDWCENWMSMAHWESMSVAPQDGSYVLLLYGVQDCDGRYCANRIVPAQWMADFGESGAWYVPPIQFIPHHHCIRWAPLMQESMRCFGMRSDVCGAPT